MIDIILTTDSALEKIFSVWCVHCFLLGARDIRYLRFESLGSEVADGSTCADINMTEASHDFSEASAEEQHLNPSTHQKGELHQNSQLHCTMTLGGGRKRGSRRSYAASGSLHSVCQVFGNH